MGNNGGLELWFGLSLLDRGSCCKDLISLLRLIYLKYSGFRDNRILHYVNVITFQNHENANYESVRERCRRVLNGTVPSAEVL